MTDTPPRDDPQCDHDWQPDDSGSVSVTGATNIRRCTRCVAFTWHQAAGTAIRTETDLHWGEGVSTDATRTGREIGIPVCDDDGRELGEMRLSYANAGVLGAILTDAAEPVEEDEPIADLMAAFEAGEKGVTVRPDGCTCEPIRFVVCPVHPGTRTAGEITITSAYERSMRLAQGHDVPPLPVPVLPTRVDDLDSDTYDALRSRYAWLESRHRDTAHSELAAINVRQAVEIGELRAALARVREVHQRDSDDKCGLCRYFDTTNWGGLRTHWPCDTIRALDGDAPKETT